jgi:ribosomal-protein-alanine N-acetyltransferase
VPVRAAADAAGAVTFPDSFETARLRAERLRPSHLDHIRAMHSDPVQMATLGGVRDEAETAAYMTRNLRHWAERGFGVWLLRDRTDEAVVGRALLRHLPVDGVDEVEVGYSLVPACWSRGLATEIADACLAHGRDRLGLSGIIGLTLPDNARSRRVLEKIGMNLEREVIHGGLPHLLYRSGPTPRPEGGGPAR